MALPVEPDVIRASFWKLGGPFYCMRGEKCLKIFLIFGFSSTFSGFSLLWNRVFYIVCLFHLIFISFDLDLFFSFLFYYSNLKIFFNKN